MALNHTITSDTFIPYNLNTKGHDSDLGPRESPSESSKFEALGAAQCPPASSMLVYYIDTHLDLT